MTPFRGLGRKKGFLKQLGEIERRHRIYCAGRRPAEIAGRTAIVVDDGIAMGATMRVALRAVRRRGPAHMVLPVAPPETLAAFRKEADEVVCLETPVMLGAMACTIAISIKRVTPRLLISWRVQPS